MLPFIIRFALDGLPFVNTVSDLLKSPLRPLGLNFTFINPCFPGAIGSFDQSGAVHPQLAVTLVITKGVLPVFLKTNSHSTSPFDPDIFPKSCSDLSNTTSAFVFCTLAIFS